MAFFEFYHSLIKTFNNSSNVFAFCFAVLISIIKDFSFSINWFISKKNHSFALNFIAIYEIELNILEK